MILVLPEDVLYIDPKYNHEEEEKAIVIHPSKMLLLNKFEKESFDKIIIINSKTEYLSALGIFNCFLLLKPNKFCEVYIEQPVSTMQRIDAEQIENLGRRGGFKDITIKPYEKWIKVNGKDIKFDTLIVSMFKMIKK